MGSDVFVDTGGFYALLVSGDDRHRPAREFMRRARKARRRLVTTDYVIDETATLLEARGLGWLAHRLFESLGTSRALRLEWMDSSRFERTRTLFLRSTGRGWSFTDCSSFVVMGELRVREALAKDAHFADAGFVPLLA
ncbi:MAG: PIN domain-containing protein [Planctomycetes bacterium]|nr:PIN domain-containing protein [Planctomycetota bacterium]